MEALLPSIRVDDPWNLDDYGAGFDLRLFFVGRNHGKKD